MLYKSIWQIKTTYTYFYKVDILIKFDTVYFKNYLLKEGKNYGFNKLPRM